MLKPPRIILRAEVTEGVPQKLLEISDFFCAAKVSVVNRAILWACKQPEDIQVQVLGLMPEGYCADLPRRIIEGMRDSK